MLGALTEVEITFVWRQLPLSWFIPSIQSPVTASHIDQICAEFDFSKPLLI